MHPSPADMPGFTIAELGCAGEVARERGSLMRGTRRRSRWTLRSLQIAVVFVTVFAIACGDAKKEGDTTGAATAALAGTYDCAPPDEPRPGESPRPEEEGSAQEVYELRADGTLTRTNPGPPGSPETKSEGSWSVAGDRVVFKFNGIPGEEVWKVEGDRISFEDVGGACTKRTG